MTASESAPSLIRIHPPAPGAATVAARAAYAELDLNSLAPQGRPYVVVNMVATADGQGRIGDDTAELGDAADAALFATLRERVDCVMAGTSTVGIESYNAPARTPEVQQRRVAGGLAARPYFATVSRSGNLPTQAPLFADPELEVIVATSSGLDLEGVAARVERIESIKPAQVLGALRERFGVRSLLLEGGPTLNHAFFANELVDELFLTIAPVLTGASDAPFPIISGLLPERQQLHLVSAFTGDEHLFLRYRVD